MAGVGFSTEHVASIMHFPDLELLRDRLLETVWFMHGQPPAPSLVLGCVQKLAGDHWPAALALLSHGLTCGLGLAMLTVLCRRGARAGASDLVTAFGLGTVLDVGLAAVCLDTVEVMRHRLKVDGLLWLAAGLRWLPKHAASSATSPLVSTP